MISCRSFAGLKFHTPLIPCKVLFVIVIINFRNFYLPLSHTHTHTRYGVRSNKYQNWVPYSVLLDASCANHINTGVELEQIRGRCAYVSGAYMLKK